MSIEFSDFIRRMKMETKVWRAVAGIVCTVAIVAVAINFYNTPRAFWRWRAGGLLVVGLFIAGGACAWRAAGKRRENRKSKEDEYDEYDYLDDCDD